MVRIVSTASVDMQDRRARLLGVADDNWRAAVLNGKAWGFSTTQIGGGAGQSPAIGIETDNAGPANRVTRVRAWVGFAATARIDIVRGASGHAGRTLTALTTDNNMQVGNGAIPLWKMATHPNLPLNGDDKVVWRADFTANQPPPQFDLHVMLSLLNHSLWIKATAAGAVTLDVAVQWVEEAP